MAAIGEHTTDFDLEAEFEEQLDLEAMQVLMKAVGILGGPRELFEHQRLTWLPSLVESIYVVMLDEETDLTYAEIAEELGITEPTVSNILNADEQAVARQLEEAEPSTEAQHVAGGLAKLAYDRIHE